VTPHVHLQQKYIYVVLRTIKSTKKQRA
jgi:hypothetical protein